MPIGKFVSSIGDWPYLVALVVLVYASSACFLELIGGQAGVRDRLLALYDTPAETFSRA